jgi:transmembrane sensor
MIPSNAMPEDQLQREALAWLSHVALGGATRDDLAALRRWRDLSPDHASALARAGQLWHRLEAPVAALVRDGVDGRAERFHVGRRAFIAGSAIAACAAAGAVMIWPPLELWPSVAELAADRRTGVGEQMHVSLGDAIKVDLNTRTRSAILKFESYQAALSSL